MPSRRRRIPRLQLLCVAPWNSSPHPAANIGSEHDQTVNSPEYPYSYVLIRFFSTALARISHTVFARSERVARRHGQIPRTCRPVASDDAGGDWDFAGLRGAARTGLGGPRDGVAVGSRRGRACQAGEPRALAATRRTAAQPQTSAAGQLDAIAILMRRTLIRTSAPILSSLRRMVPQLALANGV